MLGRKGRTVDLGFCNLWPVIKWQFKHKDEAFDPKRHKLQIEVIPSEEIKHALEKGVKAVNVTPTEPPPSPCPKRARLVIRTHGLGGAGAPLFTVKSANLKLLP